MGGWTDGCRRRLNSGNKKKRQKKPKGFYARLLLSFNFLNIDGKKKLNLYFSEKILLFLFLLAIPISLFDFVFADKSITLV